MPVIMDKEIMPSPEIFETKKVEPKDWEKFRDIRLQGLQTDPHAFGSNFSNESKYGETDWSESLSSTDRIYFAAEYNNMFVSLAGLKEINPGYWLLIAVYTLPEFRGKGLSKNIISKLLEEAKSFGIQKVLLTVNTDQESAVALYKKFGFEVIKEQADTMGDGLPHNAYYMEKILES
jgi:ribosomal protein S18 acetylase RimI-like enzyme